MAFVASAAMSTEFSGTWGISSEVDAEETPPGPTEMFTDFSGIWGIVNVVGPEPPPGPVGMVTNFTGMWGIKAYTEYYAYTNYSEWWVMHNYSTPVISGVTPANNSNGNAAPALTWNATINNPDGYNFNWSIECSNGQSNSANNAGNGSKSLSLTGLGYGNTYTVWLNVTHTQNSSKYVNNIYYFTTTTGLDATNPNPANNSVDVSFSQYNLSIYLSDPEGSSINWTIETSPDIGSNSTNSDTNGTKECIVSGNLSYETTYYWYVNLTDGNITTNNYYIFTVENLSTITNFTTTKYSSDTINLTWDKNSNITSTHIRYRIDGTAPTSITDGTLLVNTTNTYYNHTSLGLGTNYSYSLWSFNGTSNIFSSNYESGYNYTNPGCPLSLQDTGSGMNSISLSWNSGTNATRSVVFMNVSGVATYPDKDNGVEKINTTGSTGTASGLEADVLYWFAVYSYNPVSSLWSLCNDTDNASTLESAGAISNFTVDRYDDEQFNLSWDKAVPTDDTVIYRKTTGTPSYVGDGTEVYNGSATTYEDSGLTPATHYYYAAWGYNGYEFSSSSADDDNITRPSPPTNLAGDLDAGDLVMTWDKGTGASRTVIRNATGDYPELDTGYLVYNNTGTTYTVVGVGGIDYYRGWSYVEVDGVHLYSFSTNLVWGGIEINVYKEDQPHIEIGDYTVFITNSDATETYQNTSGNNPFRIDVSDVPNGDDITIQISKSGYKTRSQVMDLSENAFYSVNFYLPPSSEGSPGGDGGQDYYVPPESGDSTLLTDVFSVNDHTTDEVVTLECSPDDIEEAYVFNNSLYGGWISIADDKMTLNGNSLTIDSSVFDANSTLIRVSYYCEGGQSYSSHYIIFVQDEYTMSVPDAYVVIKRYINTTDSYNTVLSDYTDSSGQIEVDLIPDVRYYVTITKDGYETSSSYWSPPEVVYSDDAMKTFTIYTSESTKTLFDDLTFNIDPDSPEHYTNISFYFNITSDLSDLIWANMSVYYYNETTETWTVLSTQNTTGSEDLNFTYTTDNITGKYGLVCSFERTSYDFFTFGTAHDDFNNVLIYNIYNSSGDGVDLSPIDNTLGRSPVFVGEVVVAYVSLAALIILTFTFFIFSPKFAGFCVMLIGVLMGVLKQPLNLITDDVVNYTVVAVLVLLGIVMTLVIKKED